MVWISDSPLIHSQHQCWAFLCFPQMFDSLVSNDLSPPHPSQGPWWWWWGGGLRLTEFRIRPVCWPDFHASSLWDALRSAVCDSPSVSAPWYRVLISKDCTPQNDLLTDLGLYWASGRYWWKTEEWGLERFEVSLPSVPSALDCDSGRTALPTRFQFPSVGNDSRFWWHHRPFVHPSRAES